MPIDYAQIRNIGQTGALAYSEGQRNRLITRGAEKEDATNALLAQMTMPGATPEVKNAMFQQLMATNPEAAQNHLLMQQTQNQMQTQQRDADWQQQIRTAQEGLGKSRAIRESSNPVAMLEYLDPEGGLRQMGTEIGLDPSNPEDVEELMGLVEARYSMMVGQAERNSLQEKLSTVAANIGRPLTEQEVMQLAGSGGTTINIGEKLNEPIPIAQLDTVRMPDGTTVPIGTTFAEARDMGARVVSTNESTRRTQAEQALGILDELEGLALGPGGVFEEVEPGLLNRAGAAIEHGFQMLTQNDPGAARFNDMAKATLSPFIKFMGESGALADGDVQRALGLLPRTFPLPDTSEVAAEKLQSLREIVQRGVSNMNAIEAGQLPNLTEITTDEDLPPADRPTAASTARAATGAARNAAGRVAEAATVAVGDIARLAEMSIDELQTLDIDKMTEAQMQAIVERLDELGL